MNGAVKIGRDWFITWTCKCGQDGKSRWSDLKLRVDNPIASCKSCIMKHRNATLSEERLEHLRVIGREAALKQRKDRRFLSLRATCAGVKRRCVNKNCTGYENYGGRGIEFRFESPLAMAEWVVSELGYKPSNEYSLDRIDNNGHYEKGNLRWATRKEQNSNKRAYKLGAMGHRIQKLLEVTEYGYETVRALIKQGLSDEQIINRPKSTAGRPRTSTDIRPCKRRQKEQILGEREINS